MKKTLKKAALVALALCMCLSFSSCFSLDDVRASRAVYTNDAQTEIEFRGQKYKMLVEDFSHLDMRMMDTMASVVNEQVPLLLTEMYGKTIWHSEVDDRLLQIEDVPYLFCREDVYDYAAKTLEVNEFNYACVLEEDEETWEYNVKMLDKSILDVVDEIIYTAKPESDYYDWEDSIEIMATDEKALFMHSLFTVEKLTDGRYFIWMDNLSEDISGYIVSKEYESTFEPLFPEQDDDGMFIF